MTDGALSGGMRSNGPTPNVFPSPESLRPTLVGSRYMVSAGHPIVAQVAALVLERGGSAIDAGVAGGLAANVVMVDMCNFGGVAPILVRAAGSDEVWSVAGLGTWGSDATLEAFRSRFGDDMPLGGAVAIVPGAPAAWIAALARWGTWSFAEVAAPALELAADGYVLDLRTAYALELFGGHWETTRDVYWPEGRPPRLGDRLRQPQLAALLQRLVDAESGGDRAAALDRVRRAFYEGEVAERIVNFVRADSGWLTEADLAGFVADVAPAVSRPCAGWLVHTTDTWSQGPALLQALAILEGCELEAFGHNSAEYVHLVAESVKLAFSDRERWYGDPRFVDVPLARLLSDEHAAELRALIGDDALPNLSTFATPAVSRRRHDTTYLCVVDADGNAFSATPSDTLDGGPLVPELGIVVSPRGVQSRLDPNHPSALAPGKRPRLTPSPALALRRDGGADSRVWAFGCPGGDVILQAMLQVFLNVARFGMTPQQAVEAPRFASFSFPDSFYPHVEVDRRLSVEARIPAATRDVLAARGHEVHLWPEWEFDAGAVALALDLEPPTADGRILAAGADPRRVGYAIGR
ncbi:MAG TPA: gamma-glutamyltransferase [Gaiellaceae bacterium]